MWIPSLTPPFVNLALTPVLPNVARTFLRSPKDEGVVCKTEAKQRKHIVSKIDATLRICKSPLGRCQLKRVQNNGGLGMRPYMLPLSTFFHCDGKNAKIERPWLTRFLPSKTCDCVFVVLLSRGVSSKRN